MTNTTTTASDTVRAEGALAEARYIIDCVIDDVFDNSVQTEMMVDEASRLVSIATGILGVDHPDVWELEGMIQNDCPPSFF